MKNLLLISILLLLYYNSEAQSLRIENPPSVSGEYNITYADSGNTWSCPDLTDYNNAITDTLIFVEDGTAGTNAQGYPISQEGCNPLINDVSGKIAVCYRNTCEFGTKALNAQNAGAVAVIIINRDPTVIGMSGGMDGLSVTIPVIMISSIDGAILRNEILAGNTIGYIGRYFGFYPNDLMITKAGATPYNFDFITYPYIPKNQVDSINCRGLIDNAGTNDQTNVTLTLKVDGATYASSTPKTMVSATFDDTLHINSKFKPDTIVGSHTLEFEVAGNTADDYIANNSISFTMNITDTVYGLDEGNYEGGWGASWTSTYYDWEWGNNFLLNSNDIATSISFFVDSGTTIGSNVQVALYQDINTNSFEISRSSSYTIQASDIFNWVTVSIPPTNTYSGNYYSARVCRFYPDTLVIGISGGQIGYNYTSLLDINMVTYYYTTATPMIRLNLDPNYTPPPIVNTNLSSPVSCNGACDAIAVTNNSGGTGTYSVQWYNNSGAITGAHQDTIFGLCAGTYWVSVDDGKYTVIDTIIIDDAPIPTNLSISTSSDATINCGDSVNLSLLEIQIDGNTLATNDQYEITTTGNYSLSLLNMSLDSCDILGTPAGFIGYNIYVDGNLSANGILDNNNTTSIQLALNQGNVVTIEFYNDESLTGIPGSCPYRLSASINLTGPGGYNEDAIGTTNGTVVPVLVFASDNPSVNVNGQLNILWTPSNVSPNDTVWGITDVPLSNTSYTVSVDYTDACGYNLTAQQQIDITSYRDFGLTVQTNPTAGAAPLTSIFDNQTNNLSNYNFTWDFGDGTIVNDNGSFVSHTYTTAGLWTVVLVAEEISTGCTDTLVLTDHIFTTGGSPCSSNPPSASASGTDPTGCGTNDGTATATVTNGTPPYTYSWSNGGTSSTITGLSGGSYSVTVTDANACTANSSTTLTAPSAPSATASGTDPTGCGTADGAATVSATGGTTPYTYTWSNGGATSTITGLNGGTYSVTVTDDGGCTATASTTITEPSAPTVTASGTDPTGCGTTDGTATASATGGTTPYTYTWSNGGATSTITGLSGGTYSVTVTDDGGCTATGSTTITGANAPTVTALGSDPTGCGTSDGTATASATGGTPPYAYTWSNGGATSTITGLTGGTYSITVTDDGGCTANASVTLSSAGAPSLSMISSDLSCYGDNNGTAGVTVSGGVAPYTYTWSNGQTDAILTGLAGGSYSVTVTDGNACITTGSVTIEDPAELIATITPTDVSCNGGSDGACDLTVTGGTMPYAFSWSNGETTASISGLTSGTYSVVVTDSNSCTASESATINEQSTGPQTGSILGLTQVSPLDQEQYSVSQTVGSTYDWSTSGGNIISGQGTNVVQIQWGNAGTGQVAVVETDAAGCVGDTVTLEVQIGTSTGIENASFSEMNIFPNPTTGMLTIEGAEGAVTVYDIYGRLVLSTNSNTLDISHTAMGIYFVRVLDEQGRMYSQKIIKE